MLIINPLHHHFDPVRLDRVVERMKTLGAPEIRAYFDGTIWHAREGTHRLRAAKLLGFTPTLIPVTWNKSKLALERAQIAAILNAHKFF